MPQTHVARIRLSEDEKQRLDAYCEEHKIGASSVLRAFLRKELDLSLPLAEPDRERLAGIAEDLRRIGINLNQAVRAMNEGRVSYERRLAEGLSVLLDTIVSLRREIDQLEKPSLRAARE